MGPPSLRDAPECSLRRLPNGQQQGNRAEHERIGCRAAKVQSRHQASQAECGTDADGQPYNRQQHSLAIIILCTSPRAAPRAIRMPIS